MLAAHDLYNCSRGTETCSEVDDSSCLGRLIDHKMQTRKIGQLLPHTNG